LTTLAVLVFILVYIGMALGRVPGLQLERTGVALLGLIVLLASGDLTLEEAGRAVDMPTIALLFALMILSAQFEQSGFYGLVASRVTHVARNPSVLLALLITVTGILSAILTNDVIAFALTPLICAGLRTQRLDPRPYLVALAGAANAGSTGATLNSVRSSSCVQRRRRSGGAGASGGCGRTTGSVEVMAPLSARPLSRLYAATVRLL